MHLLAVSLFSGVELSAVFKVLLGQHGHLLGAASFECLHRLSMGVRWDCPPREHLESVLVGSQHLGGLGCALIHLSEAARCRSHGLLAVLSAFRLVHLHIEAVFVPR